MSKDNEIEGFEQAFTMDAQMPEFPEYEIVASNKAPAPAAAPTPEPEEEIPDLEQDMVEVRSRIDSFKDMLKIGDKFGMTDEQRKMISTQLSELETTYVKLQKTLNLEEPAPTASLIEPKKPEEAKPTVPAAAVSAADSIPAQDFTDLDKFTQMKNEEAKQPFKAKSLKDRIKSVRSNINEEEGEIQKDNRPQYVKDFEKNLMPETELNVKTNGRSRYLTNDELKNLFGDNYLHSRDNIEEGKLTSRTHYFGDGLLIKETEDAIAIRGRRKANDIAVDLIDVAKQKGWNSIVLTKGNPVFMEQAYISAIKNGIRVEATSLKQEEEFQMIHKSHNLDRYMKFGEPKKEEIKKEEPMPEYQVQRGRSLKM
ncbi:TPA: hypothetical protein RFW42_004824 [Klebsiella pneumoniae subsp. pneumoniae]|nr:hypothetical protein [Klebsiella pneumoniae subsp. pneumoniae]HDU3724732.1 hypothetical protein [Klebsiella pneumoniae subsp. pneumoniae]HDU3740275.1 hypothetical protein [Klebsiella pneumoniae subsp. pneumoniae]HDU5904440.1 hypothetical protein [Klebsiella pneumoniae subsp. pneumoniae]